MRILAIIAMLFAVPVSADGVKLPTTVAEFVEVLEAQENPVFYTWVTGYIWGVDAGLFVGHPCYVGATDQNTNRQIADIFLTFANEHKDRWDAPNAIHIITATALLKAFPCEEKPEASPMKQNPERKL